MKRHMVTKPPLTVFIAVRAATGLLCTPTHGGQAHHQGNFARRE